MLWLACNAGVIPLCLVVVLKQKAQSRAVQYRQIEYLYQSIYDKIKKTCDNILGITITVFSFLIVKIDICVTLMSDEVRQGWATVTMERATIFPHSLQRTTLHFNVIAKIADLYVSDFCYYLN